MKFYEYGKKNLHKIMLIHGGGNSKWMFEKQALLLKNDYRVILPELDGHGKEKDIIYNSTYEEASKIIEYIDNVCNGSLFCIGGASLGAQIALEVLGRKNNNIKNAFLESGIYFPQKFNAKIMSYQYIIKCMIKLYNLKWIVNLSFKNYGWISCNIDKIIEDAKLLSVESNANLYKTYLNYHISENLKNTTANVLLVYGSKEKKIIKKNVILFNNLIKKSNIEEIEGYNHCGFSFNNPEGYVEKLKKFLAEKY